MRGHRRAIAVVAIMLVAMLTLAVATAPHACAGGLEIYVWGGGRLVGAE